MTDPVQEQLKLIRRNQILDAAAKVFALKGFHPTTIKDIAKEAGLADGTIYLYFKNKPALLTAVFDRMRDLMKPDDDIIAGLVDADFPTFLKTFLKLPLEALSDNDFQVFKVIVSEMMVDDDLKQLYYGNILQPTLALGEAYFEQWAQQTGRDNLDTALITRSISSLVMGLMIQHIMGDELLQTRWDDLPDFLTNLLIQGLENTI